MDKNMDKAFPAEKNVFADITGTIGRTPLVRLNQVTRGLECEVFAKLEMFNPGGSVKDRIAFYMLDEYESKGLLKPGGTVVESTSGNTGVGLAIACAMKGYSAVFVMPDKMSEEKVQLLRAFGARVVITPTAVLPEDPRSYYSVAKRIVAETPNAILANQYHNPANPEAHYLKTAPELWDQTEGRVTDIVIGMGTGGTITGVARYMRENGHEVKIVGVDPEGSLLYDAWKQGGSTEGLTAETYKVEGIGEDFIPSTLDLSIVDHVVQVGDAESFHWTRRLVREEGIFCGGSSGSAFAGALKYCQDLPVDRLVVVVFPDSGSRYLSKIFNDAWLREHRLFVSDQPQITAGQVARLRGLPGLVVGHEDDRVVDVISKMRKNGISQIPIVNEAEALLGIVSEVDILDQMLSPDQGIELNDSIDTVLTKDVLTVPIDTPFDTLLNELVAVKVAVLVDEEKKPVDILTVIDALDYFALPTSS
jgi:cystathionine beta-synthase